MNEIQRYSELNPEQKNFIFTYLAMKKPFVEIKSDFEKLFETKIRGEILVAINKKFETEIKEISEKELNDIEKEPLAHSRIRMQFLYKALQYAFTPKLVDSKRVGPTDWERQYDINHSAVAKYLQLAQSEEYMAKRLYYEILKNKDVLGEAKPQSGFRPIQVNTGLVWDDAETV